MSRPNPAGCSGRPRRRHSCTVTWAAEHILLDSTGREVTGIIDWCDIAIGDPAVDLTGLFHWCGELFPRSGLSNYTGLELAAP